LLRDFARGSAGAGGIEPLRTNAQNIPVSD
jgi:hypothetical protein